MDQFTERLSRLADLSDDDLSQLEQELVDAFDSADQSGDTNTMQQLADALDNVRSEAGRRSQGQTPATPAAPAATATPAATAASVEVEDESETENGGETEGEEPAPSETEEGEAPADTPEEAPAEAPAEEQEPDASSPDEAPAEDAPAETSDQPTEEENVAEVEVTAADVPEDRKPVPVAAAAVTFRAGGDIPGISAGVELTGMDDVIEAMTRKVNAMRGVSGDGEHVIVASIRYEQQIPEEKVLRPGDPNGNAQKIRTLLSDRDNLTPEGMVAAGWCAPRMPIYDVPTIGTTGRPIRDSIPTFGADRGGVTWMQPPSLATVTAAMAQWVYFTNNPAGWGSWLGPVLPPANQAGPPAFPPAVAATPTAAGNVKPCIEVPCGTEVSSTVSAVSICLCFDNLVARAFPEWIRANTDLTLVAQARFAEQMLLAQMFNFATDGGGTTGAPALEYGAARDLLATVRLAASQFRWSNRLAADQPLQFIAPSWARDAIASDLSLQAPGDDTISVSNAEIAGYFADINVQPIWFLDEVPNGAGAQNHLTERPNTTSAGPAVAQGDQFDSYIAYGANVNWLLYPTGSFTLLDSGGLDLGVVRTKDDIVRNKYCEFSETAESLAYLGPAAPGWVVRGQTPITIKGGTSCCVAAPVVTP